MKDYTWKQARI